MLISHREHREFSAVVCPLWNNAGYSGFPQRTQRIFCCFSSVSSVGHFSLCSLWEIFFEHLSDI